MALLSSSRLAGILAAALLCLVPYGAAAQSRASPGERCLAISSAPPRVMPVTYRMAALEKAQVGLTFIGHSTFLIESAAGVTIATDYNDYVRPTVLPKIVTMNKAHNTHYTNFPDPRIRHVLKGWDEEGRGARHDLEVDDVRVRNVPTNIRNWQGGTEYYANSIFVFEIAGLCIGHLGHLHHPLTAEHFAQIGQLDVVLVPVDGSYTMDVDGMITVVKALHSRLIIPMHFFNRSTLDRFLNRMRDEFPIEHSDTASIIVSRRSLPQAPKILVLPGF